MQHAGFSLWLTACSLIISSSKICASKIYNSFWRRDSEAAQSNRLHSWLYQSKPVQAEQNPPTWIQTEDVSNVGGRKSSTGKQKIPASSQQNAVSCGPPNSCSFSSLRTTCREMCMLWCCTAPSEQHQHRKQQLSMNRQHILCCYSAAVWTQATRGCYKHSESSRCSDPLESFILLKLCSCVKPKINTELF